MAWRGLLHGSGPAPAWVYLAFLGGKVLRTWALFDADDALSVTGIPVSVFTFLLTAFAAAIYLGAPSAAALAQRYRRGAAWRSASAHPPAPYASTHRRPSDPAAVAESTAHQARYCALHAPPIPNTRLARASRRRGRIT